MDTLDAVVNDADSSNSEIKPKRLTAFDLAQSFRMYATLVRIDGSLYLFDWNNYRYMPIEKENLVKALLRVYYKELSESGSLRLARECADILCHMDFIEYSSADIGMKVCLQNGYVDLDNLESAQFIYYKQMKVIPVITYNIATKGDETITNWGRAKTFMTPQMDGFLNCIAQGNATIVNRLWQMIGYLLTPDTNAKAWFLLQGVPNSGKSVIGNLITAFFPDFRIESLDIDQLGKRTSSSLLVNKSVNISMDLPNKALSPLAIRNIKLMTGNDDITVEYGNGKYKKYRSTCKFLFATNHPLTLRGCDSGFEERIVCIPFPKSVERSQRNVNLLNALLMERNEIVAKALAHYRDLRLANYEFAGSNLDICRPIIRYLPTEAEDTDAHLCEFVDTCCTIVPISEGRTYTDTLYRAYKNFCQRNNYTPMSDSSSFSRRLHKCYGDRIKKEKWRNGKDNQNGFSGIILNVKE